MNKLKLLAIIFVTSIFSFGSAQADPSGVCTYKNSGKWKAAITTKAQCDKKRHGAWTIDDGILGTCEYDGNNKTKKATLTRVICEIKRGGKWTANKS